MFQAFWSLTAWQEWKMFDLSSQRSLHILVRVSLLLRLEFQSIHSELSRCAMCLKSCLVVGHFYLGPLFVSIALIQRPSFSLAGALPCECLRYIIKVQYIVHLCFPKSVSLYCSRIFPSNWHVFLTSSMSSSTEFRIQLRRAILTLLS